MIGDLVEAQCSRLWRTLNEKHLRCFLTSEIFFSDSDLRWIVVYRVISCTSDWYRRRLSTG